MSRRFGQPDEHARHVGERLIGHLADAVHLLLPEAEPEPGVDQGRVVRRDQGVVGVLAGIDPDRRGDRVQVAHDLGLGDGLPGGLDPGVRSPHRVVLGLAEQVAGDLAARRPRPLRWPRLPVRPRPRRWRRRGPRTWPTATARPGDGRHAGRPADDRPPPRPWAGRRGSRSWSRRRTVTGVPPDGERFRTRTRRSLRIALDTTQLLKGVLDVGDASVNGTMRRLYSACALTSYVVLSDEGRHSRRGRPSRRRVAAGGRPAAARRTDGIACPDPSPTASPSPTGGKR